MRQAILKCIKKPIEVEAVKFDGSLKSSYILYDFCGDNIDIDLSTQSLKIKTLEGTMTARVGDYIIRGVEGEFYPCRGDIFERTYDIIQSPS